MCIRRICLVAALLLCCATPVLAADDVVISQVYGGGGNQGATWLNDFIELLNAGGSTVNLQGWSVQYTSAAGSSWHNSTPLSGTLEPGQYLLVQEGRGPTGDGAPLPFVDIAVGAIQMGEDSGKVALVHSTDLLSGACPTNAVDLVTYGSGTCDATGVTLTEKTAAIRLDSGCDNNSTNAADFETGAPSPRHRGSPKHTCVDPAPVNTPPDIIPPPVPYTIVLKDAAPFPVTLSGTDDNNVFFWSATSFNGIQSVIVTNQTAPTATFTVTLAAGFQGMASFIASLSDNVNPADQQLVEITVNDPSHVVISQIYAAGGKADSRYRNDFVQLYNPTDAAVLLDGWTLQYGSATSSGWSRKQRLRDTIGSRQYYLIVLGSDGTGGEPLPQSNVENKGMNLAAAEAKLALVRVDQSLDGCALGDPTLIDLVGYGGKGDCAEGGARAPAGSATLASFRKDRGATDTDNNANDFETGAPDPFRDAPIVERGPTVLRIEPFTEGARDASITVTFSEPVLIEGSEWFRISCTQSGLHRPADTTVASVHDDAARIITPNDEFQPAERCSVTVFAGFVRDRDTDDSAPGTDVMASDKNDSFSISDGAPPPYPPEVHLAMGNPSGAKADPATPGNYLMMKPEYALSYNVPRGNANWASWHLDAQWIAGAGRADSFRPDPAVRPPWYRVLDTDYEETGFERGHLVPNADRQMSLPINHATYLMTNMLPQTPDCNKGPWEKLEAQLRKLTDTNELYIVAGGLGTGGTSDEGTMDTIAGGKVTVPAKVWKVALVLPKGENDVDRADANTRTIAVIMPNVQGIRPDPWENYLVTVDRVENETGYDFFSNVRDEIEEIIEAGKNGANPPGAGDQSIATDEDLPRSFALNAIVPAGNASFAIVDPPDSGSLTGTGANRTYTPLPNFHGTDGFTFQVSNAAGSSKPATVSITVAEVNDPPAAAADRFTTVRERRLQFQASDLTLNDTPGPANELAQRLTVLEVTQTGDTHGTVSMNGGIVTYDPAPGFSGTAAFTYRVCDDGVTRGIAAPLCTTANVNVVVGATVSKRRSVRS